MMFADGEERKIPFPQPDFFSVRRRPVSRQKSEADDCISVSAFYKEHEAQEEEQYDYTAYQPAASSGSILRG